MLIYHDYGSAALFARPSCQAAATHADGSEHHNVVSLGPEQKKKMEEIASKIMREMKKEWFSAKELDSPIAMPSSRSG